jgi:hypothetical protein
MLCNNSQLVFKGFISDKDTFQSFKYVSQPSSLTLLKAFSTTSSGVSVFMLLTLNYFYQNSSAIQEQHLLALWQPKSLSTLKTPFYLL